ncbi:FAD-binding oxidoreductase [uncultured Jatrophihabitans sp.]|uniref:FAD-binding oxidoreductase n=1 Tax=uncultured Jatrophihabitans sp. TaxID=1610747 RepID=UPI0035CA582D
MTRPVPTGAWRTGTVREIDHPNAHAVVLRLEVPDRIDHVPGQHYAIRLTAEDGYVAQRSYSIASAPADKLLEFYIERLDDGEVSTFLADVVEIGDELALRGPIGGWFVWQADTPALGVAGGSGAVPLVAMLRHARNIERTELLSLAVSARSLDRLPYPDELVDAGAVIALTRQDYRTRRAARLSAADLTTSVPADGPCFVCGSSGFAEAATDLLRAVGVDDTRIRVERFGPTG